MAGKSKVPLHGSEILAVHRLKPRTDGKVTKVVVHLSNRIKRDAIVFAKKDFTNLEFTGVDSGKIYIGESLTPYFSDLMYKARVKAKQEGYERVWYSKFSVFVKKTKDKDKAGIIRICCENELSKIVPLTEIN